MPSSHELFWSHDRYAVVGRSRVKPFPALTYQALRRRSGTTVYAVDPEKVEIEGDRAYADLADLPEPVDAVILEVPKEETAAWVEKVAAAGIGRVWIHMGRETAEALARAEDAGLEVLTGTCAVQYLDQSFPHNVHRFFRRLAGRW